MQPGLAVVLSATTGTDTTRYVHGSRGIHAQQDSAGAWDWLVQDGLGSVRAVVDGTLAVQERRMYAPYGEPYDGMGTNQTVYGFTGEPTDVNELVYLRARYLNPGLGVFASRDPWEGIEDEPMTLNGYAYVSGNPINFVDSTGNCPANPTNIFDFRCWDLARGLAARFNAPVENFSWMTYEQLELATIQVNFWGTLANASILPNLALREDPRLVLQAIQQWACQQNMQQMMVGGFGLLGSLRANPTAAGVGAAVGVGIAAGIGLLLAVNTIVRSRNDVVAQANAVVNDYINREPEEQQYPPPQPNPQPTSTPQSCDPTAFRNWWLRQPARGGIRVGVPDYDYEQRVCRDNGTMGHEARQIVAGTETINADGADPNTCRLLECKHSTTPNTPRLRVGGFPGSLNDFEDEVRRYRLAINTSNGLTGAQPTGLEVRTNAQATRDYAASVLPRHGFTIGTDGFCLVIP